MPRDDIEMPRSEIHMPRSIIYKSDVEFMQCETLRPLHPRSARERMSES